MLIVTKDLDMKGVCAKMVMKNLIILVWERKFSQGWFLCCDSVFSHWFGTKYIQNSVQMVVNEQAENDVATITDMKQPSGGK